MDGPVPFLDFKYWRLDFAQPVPFESGPFELKAVGDRFLLTTDAIAEELERIGSKPSPVVKCAPAEPESPEAEAIERVKRRLRSVK